MAKQFSLAVLPFVNLSSSEENEYFSDGMTEEIINALAKIEELKVISRTSSFYFKNKNIPLKLIAEQLKVQHILEGSVRVSIKNVRISTKLVHADEDTTLWSESWDRQIDNIFEVQDEISLLIAEKLREQLGHFEISEHLVNKQTDRLNAYQLSLKARYYFNRWNPQDVFAAIALYQQALQIDPQHAESHVGLADGYSFLGTTGFMDGAHAWEKAIEHTNTALALDPKNPGVHYLLANISFFTACDFAAAAKHGQRAVELKSNYAEGQQYMAFLHTLRADMSQARIHLNKALELDPLNPETLFYKALFHYRNGEFEKAKSILEELLKQNPKNIPAFTVLAYCLLCLNDSEAALRLFDALPDDVVIPDEKLGIQTLAAIKANDESQLDNYLKKLSSRAEETTAYQAHSYLFLAMAMQNKADQAFELLQKFLALRSPIFLISFSDPLAAGLRDDPRYRIFHDQLYPDFRLSGAVADKKQALLDEHTASVFVKKLLEFTSQELPFLNPDLSLRTLARLTEIHPNQLSWLLNNKLNQNFNEFINSYRLEYFKKLVKDPGHKHISIIGLAFESGFNSKTVFNNFFKKSTGITPSQYARKASDEWH